MKAKHPNVPVEKITNGNLASLLWKMAKDGEIVVVAQGSGTTPSTYRRAQPKEATA